MHPCLAIPEIFSLICDEIRRQEYQPQDLASLARTCRAWTEIALDNLWYRIDGIDSLIKSMPRDLWGKDEGGCVCLKRPLKKSDFQIFTKYARRVRCFSEGELWCSTAVYEALSSQSRDFLLPRLEQLEWFVLAEAFLYIRLFLHPGLKRLGISFCVHNKAQLSFFSTIPTIFAPNISTLDMYLVSHADFLTKLSVEGFSDALQSWRGLSNLTFNNAPVHCLFYTTRVPTLKTLKIHLSTQSQGPSRNLSQLPLNLHPRPEPFFPLLEVLSIKNIHTTSVVVQFLKAFRNAQLSRLELGFNNLHDTSDVVRGFLDTLHYSCNMHSLKAIQFDHKVHLPFSAIIFPLLRFPMLERVYINLGHALGISEEQMLHIASSWPGLEVLHITPFAERPSTSPTTLSSLVPLAWGCPKLCELSLTIDASDAATRQRLRAKPGNAKGTRNLSLRSLCVGWISPISHQDFVASFLADIFPNLEDILPRRALIKAQQTEHRRQWEYVAQALLLSRARARDDGYLGVSESQVSSGVGSVVSGHQTARWLATKRRRTLQILSHHGTGDSFFTLCFHGSSFSLSPLGL